jgi:hypothetical protein
MKIDKRLARNLALALLALLLAPAVAWAQTGVLFVEGDKVGIGVATPSELLHVKASSPGNTLAFIENSTGPNRVGSRYKSSLAIWDFRMDGVGDFIFDDPSTAGEELKIRRNGEVRIGPPPGTILLQPDGDIVITGTLMEVSSRTSKEGFVTLEPRAVLEKIAAMEVVEWSYKDQAARHVGPMAEDFRTAFGLGENDTTLSPRDVAGVALLALQGLHQEVEARDAEIERLHEEMAELRAMVEALGAR